MKAIAIPLDEAILKSFSSSKTGRVFSARHFEKLGSPEAVRQALSRLVKYGKIRRVARGVYDLPRQHPIIGQTSPDITAMVRTLMKKSQARWQFSGAYAANALGLSEQVPAKIVVLTSGISRRVMMGNLPLSFQHASPRNLLGAGHTTGLVIQALRYLGKNEITPARIQHLRKILDTKTKAGLLSLCPKAPVWMRPFVVEIAQE